MLQEEGDADAPVLEMPVSRVIRGDKLWHESPGEGQFDSKGDRLADKGLF